PSGVRPASTMNSLQSRHQNVILNRRSNFRCATLRSPTLVGEVPMRKLVALVPALAFALGCSAGAPPPPLTVTFGPITVPAGTEKTQCVVKRLHNDGQVHVGSIHNVLGDASHHMIVYRVGDTVEQPQPFDCVPFRDTL